MLNARRVRVIGNVQGENARGVAVRQSWVGGSVQIVQGRSATVRSTRVNADILYDENSSALRAVDNIVGESIQAFQNSGGVGISRNRIDEQPAVQGERSGTDRRRQRGSGKHGGPVRGAQPGLRALSTRL